MNEKQCTLCGVFYPDTPDMFRVPKGRKSSLSRCRHCERKYARDVAKAKGTGSLNGRKRAVASIRKWLSLYGESIIDEARQP